VLRVNQADQLLKDGLKITELKTERRASATPDSIILALKTRRMRQFEERLKAGVTVAGYGARFD
jgi:hypothetical protein